MFLVTILKGDMTYSDDKFIEFILKHVYYDKKLGIPIWKERKDNPSFNKQYAGKEAFSHHRADGYKYGGVNDPNCKMIYISQHKIVWILNYKEMPQLPIDHINRDPADNHIDNLKLSTVSENNRNRKRFKNNKSGYSGVHESNGSWKARNIGGSKTKSFSIKKYGPRKAKQLAVAQRKLWEESE